MPVSLVRDVNAESFNQGAVDAVLLRAGARIAEPHERHREFSGRPLASIARRCLQNRGLDDSCLGDADVLKLCLDKRAFARELSRASLGHSTSDFDSILEASANKSLALAYTAAQPTWMAWARRTETRDFKQVSVANLGSLSELLAIAEGAEYQFGTIGEGSQTYTLAKYGRGFSITWESLINDDLSAFSRIPTAMGQAARRLEDSLVYSVIFAANAGAGQTMSEDSLALFASGHGNVGTTATLSIASLGDAAAKLRVQKAPGSGDSDDGGDFLNLSPHVLLVPPALEATALQLTSSLVDPALANAAPSPFAGKLRVVVEPRLAAVDSNGWWLVADSAMIDLAHVCFLQSEPNPVVEEESSFVSDGRRFKVRHSVAAAAIDYRGFVKNAGGS